MRLALVGIMVVALDQGSKWAIRHTMFPGESLPALPPVVYFTYVQNPGAAFGLFAHQSNFLIAVTILVVALAFLYRRDFLRQPVPARLGLTLGLGGAAGNLIDRIARGWVIDFIDFRFFPVFNVADAAIVVGVGLLFWSMLVGGKSSTRKAGEGSA